MVRATIEIALASSPTFTFFYGPFYGRAKSCCKTVQLYITPCKRYSLGLSMIRNAVQHSENVRTSLDLNYKSAALNQLSYAGVPYTKAAFSNLIKGCDDPISRTTTHVDTLFRSRLKSRLPYRRFHLWRIT
jgi:hypothetical protein